MLEDNLNSAGLTLCAFKKDHFINRLEAGAMEPKRRSSSSAPARTPTAPWRTADAKWMVWKCCGSSKPKSAGALFQVEERDTADGYKLAVNNYSVKSVDLEQLHRGNVYSGSIMDTAQPAASAFGVTHND